MQIEKYFGPYGGRYVPEMLIPALDELTSVYAAAQQDAAFVDEFQKPREANFYSGNSFKVYYVRFPDSGMVAFIADVICDSFLATVHVNGDIAASADNHCIVLNKKTPLHPEGRKHTSLDFKSYSLNHIFKISECLGNSIIISVGKVSIITS